MIAGSLTEWCRELDSIVATRRSDGDGWATSDCPRAVRRRLGIPSQSVSNDSVAGVRTNRWWGYFVAGVTNDSGDQVAAGPKEAMNCLAAEAGEIFGGDPGVLG